MERPVEQPAPYTTRVSRQRAPSAQDGSQVKPALLSGLDVIARIGVDIDGVRARKAIGAPIDLDHRRWVAPFPRHKEHRRQVRVLGLKFLAALFKRGLERRGGISAKGCNWKRDSRAAGRVAFLDATEHAFVQLFTLFDKRESVSLLGLLGCRREHALPSAVIAVLGGDFRERRGEVLRV